MLPSSAAITRRDMCVGMHLTDQITRQQVDQRDSTREGAEKQPLECFAEPPPHQICNQNQILTPCLLRFDTADSKWISGCVVLEAFGVVQVLFARRSTVVQIAVGCPHTIPHPPPHTFLPCRSLGQVSFRKLHSARPQIGHLQKRPKKLKTCLLSFNLRPPSSTQRWHPFLTSKMDQDGLFLMLKMCNGCSHNKVRVTAGGVVSLDEQSTDGELCVHGGVLPEPRPVIMLLVRTEKRQEVDAACPTTVALPRIDVERASCRASR